MTQLLLETAAQPRSHSVTSSSSRVKLVKLVKPLKLAVSSHTCRCANAISGQDRILPWGSVDRGTYVPQQIPAKYIVGGTSYRQGHLVKSDWYFDESAHERAVVTKTSCAQDEIH